MKASKIKVMANFATPESQTKSKALSHFFYPVSSDASSSIYMQSAENLNKLLSNNAKAESLANPNNEMHYAQNIRQNYNIASRATRESSEKKGANEQSLSSVNTKKQVRNYTKVGSTNDASTLNYD